MLPPYLLLYHQPAETGTCRNKRACNRLSCNSEWYSSTTLSGGPLRRAEGRDFELMMACPSQWLPVLLAAASSSPTNRVTADQQKGGMPRATKPRNQTATNPRGWRSLWEPNVSATCEGLNSTGGPPPLSIVIPHMGGQRRSNLGHLIAFLLSQPFMRHPSSEIVINHGCNLSWSERGSLDDLSRRLLAAGPGRRRAKGGLCADEEDALVRGGGGAGPRRSHALARAADGALRRLPLLCRGRGAERGDREHGRRHQALRLAGGPGRGALVQRSARAAPRLAAGPALRLHVYMHMHMHMYMCMHMCM